MTRITQEAVGCCLLLAFSYLPSTLIGPINSIPPLLALLATYRPTFCTVLLSKEFLCNRSANCSLASINLKVK